MRKKRIPRSGSMTQLLATLAEALGEKLAEEKRLIRAAERFRKAARRACTIEGLIAGRRRTQRAQWRTGDEGEVDGAPPSA